MSPRDILYWLGNQEYCIGRFTTGFGLMRKDVGGKWRDFPEKSINELIDKGFLNPNSPHNLTSLGRKVAAIIYFAIDSDDLALAKEI